MDTLQNQIKQAWKYSIKTTSLADTGDYDSVIEFTNGKDVLYSNSDDIEEEQCQEFCNLLNLMPDLWSVRTDAAEFELTHLKKEIKNGELPIIEQRACAFATWMEDNNFYKSESKQGVRLYSNNKYGQHNTKEDLFQHFIEANPIKL